MIFPRSCRALAAAALSVGLAACSSAPMHFYTLVPPSVPTRATAAPFAFELLPVAVPAEDDLPQLVVRTSNAQAQILDNERWIGPLADQAHNALSADLSRALDSRDVSGLTQATQKLLRIKVELRRFESSYGGYASIDAAWSVHPLWLHDRPALICSSQLRQPVAKGYDALVLGHQQLLQQLSDRIAGTARQLAAGIATACPAD